MTIIWCMIPEISSTADRGFCPSGPFFALSPPYGPRKSKLWKNEQHTWRYHFTMQMCTINNSHLMYGSWDMKSNRQNFLSFCSIFYPFNRPPPPSPRPNNLKNLNFEKLKKTPGDIIILHVYHKWQSNDVWFLRYWGWQRFFCHFGPFFALLPPLTTQNIKILKKFKKYLGILSFYTCVP